MNLTTDFLPRFMKKHRTFYAFVCSQSVRRDQFYWHYRNLHNDVISSLDGWMLRRCPYTQYGCNKQFARLVPSGKLCQKLRFNPILTSFAFLDDSKVSKSHNKCRSLADLPVEILLEITSFMDGASLSCLSMTCQSLRDICAAKLLHHGIVEEKWIRTRNENGRVFWVSGGFVSSLQQNQ